MAIKNYLSAIHADWYGNGRAGWKERICTFIDQFEAVEEEREKTQSLRHTENSEKMEQMATTTAQSGNAIQRLIFVVMFLTLVVAALGVFFGYIEAKRAGIIPYNILVPDKSSQVYDAKESIPRDSAIPYHSY